MVDKVTFGAAGCGGCRTCEIACSYHHKKVFSRSLSSMEVKERLEVPGFEVSFYLASTNNHLACDGCKGEDEPLCLKYCSVSMRERLKTILQSELPKKSAGEVKRGK